MKYMKYSFPESGNKAQLTHTGKISKKKKLLKNILKISKKYIKY